MIKFIFFLLAYGVFAQQATCNGSTDIELFEYIVKKVEKEYVWPIDQKTLIEYAVEGVLDKLNSELNNERKIKITSYADGIECFEEVLEQIQKKYLVDQETLIEYGVIGIFSKLDPYSYYLDSKKFKDMQLQTSELNTVSTEIVDDIVYIKISEFNESTYDNFRKQWLNAKENSDTIESIVLDLRNNSGGLFSQAILICDSFLDGGEMVIVQSKGASDKKYYVASKGDIFSGLPLTVLIDKKSASASEIVAAVLQNSKRGKIVGVKSFGKASGQTIFPLKNGGAISVTNKLYYLPSGNLITGVIPDK